MDYRVPTFKVVSPHNNEESRRRMSAKPTTETSPIKAIVSTRALGNSHAWLPALSTVPIASQRPEPGRSLYGSRSREKRILATLLDSAARRLMPADRRGDSGAAHRPYGSLEPFHTDRDHARTFDSAIHFVWPRLPVRVLGSRPYAVHHGHFNVIRRPAMDVEPVLLSIKNGLHNPLVQIRKERAP